MYHTVLHHLLPIISDHIINYLLYIVEMYLNKHNKKKFGSLSFLSNGLLSLWYKSHLCSIRIKNVFL